MVAEIFRPVGGIGDLYARPKDAAHVRRKLDQLGDHREAVGGAADLGETAQFGADQEGFHPTRRLAQPGIVQDEAAVGPFGGAGIGDRLAVECEVAGLDGAEEARDLGRSGRGTVGRAGDARGQRGGDPTAPRQHRLPAHAGPGVGEPIARHLGHQHEGIEGHRLAGIADGADRLDHRLVGRRAAIDRPAVVVEGHEPSAGAGEPRNGPGHFMAVAVVFLDLGGDLAGRTAQIVAEPGDHKRHRLEVGQFALEHVERDREIGHPEGGMFVLRHLLTRQIARMHRGGGERVFAGTGDQRHGLRPPRDFARLVGLFRPDDLEIEHRDPVAVGGEVELFDHHVGGATVRRHVARAFDRLDLGIGRLRLGAGVDADVEVRHGHFGAVDPDPADPGDLAFAEPQREALVVVVLDRVGSGGGAGEHALAEPAAAGAFVDRLGGLANARCPDHLAADPHPPPDPRDRRAFRGAGDAEPVHAAGLDRLAAVAHELLVDGRARDRAQRPADRHRGQAENATADRGAQRRARSRENDCRHVRTPFFDPLRGNGNTPPRGAPRAA